MKIKVVGSSIDDRSMGPQFAASYILNGSVAIDAGSIGMISSVGEQCAIKHIFLSHSHLDHIASLPIFLDNVYAFGPDCPTIYGSTSVRDCLLQDMFNERMWPDLIRLSKDESPFLRFLEIENGVTTEVEGLRLTPVELHHVVPVFGFIIEEADSAIAIISDTGPTDAMWSQARSTPNLKAVFLESAFPNSMAWLAERAGHLTPQMFRDEYQKLGLDLPVYAVHIKPAFYDEVVGDLKSLGLAQLEITRPNTVYEF